MKIKARWQVSGHGEIEVDSREVCGMTAEEIEDWVSDGVHLEIHEQGNYGIRIDWHEKDSIEQLAKAARGGDHE